MTFTFRPILTIATLIGLSILFGLGTWQLHRLDWKRDLLATIDARLALAPQPVAPLLARHGADEDVAFFPVQLTGVFEADGEARVFGTLDGVPGAYLFTPLVLPDGRWLYVNRGFVAQEVGPDAVLPPSGPVTVTGVLREYQPLPTIARWVNPPSNPEANRWYKRDPVAFSDAYGGVTQGVWIDAQFAAAPADWPKPTPTLANLPNRHLEYALTWFGLAATLLGVFAVFSVRRV